MKDGKRKKGKILKDKVAYNINTYLLFVDICKIQLI